MIVKFDSLDRYETPNFILCNPGSLRTSNGPTYSLGMLTGVSDVEIVFNFNEVSELSMRVTKFEYDGYGTEYDSDIAEDIIRRYDLIENRRLLFDDDLGYFVITNMDENFEDGVWHKDIKAESIEAELKQKNVPYIPDGTYKFYNNDVSNLGLLNMIVDNLPNWSIDHIDQSLENIYRTFEDVDEKQNCLSFLIEEMQEAYGCVFEFDTRLRTISAYAQSDYISQTNIMMTNHDIVEALTITENADELYTSLNVRASDESITVGALNPTGMNTIYRFDYYLGWMTPALATKVQAWETAIANAEAAYRTLNETYYDDLTDYYDKLMEVDKYDTVLSIYQRLYDNISPMRNFSSSTSTLSSYNTSLAKYGMPAVTPLSTVAQTQQHVAGRIATIQASKASAEAEANAAQQAALAKLSQIAVYQNNLSMANYFNTTELRELSNYIFEGTYTDDYVIITDSMSYSEKFEQMQTLYDRSKEQLQRVSMPSQEFDVDVENFAFIKDFSHWTSQLKTGCSINVELKPEDWAVLFLSAITINYEDHDMSLTFSSRLNKYDRKTLFQDLLGSVSQSANSISYVKDLTIPLKNGQFDQMAETLRTSKNITMETALAETDEQVVIDGSGYTGKKVTNGVADNKQVKIVHNAIVFTDDAWQTSKTAVGEFTYVDPATQQNVTTYGVIADTLAGNLILGQNVGIYNSGQSVSITQDGFLITVPAGTVSNNLFKIRKNDGHGNYTNLLYVDSSGNLSMTGAITASSGTIGGWTIGENELYAELSTYTWEDVQEQIGTETQLAYDAQGNPIWETDGNGNPIEYIKVDANGDPIPQRDSGGNIIYQTTPKRYPDGEYILDGNGNYTYDPVYVTEYRQATVEVPIYGTVKRKTTTPTGTHTILKSAGEVAIGVATDTLDSDNIPDPSAALFKVTAEGETYSTDLFLGGRSGYGSGITFERDLANSYVSQARLWAGPDNPASVWFGAKDSNGQMANSIAFSDAGIRPLTNNDKQSLGTSNRRWKNVYTGSINATGTARIGSQLQMIDTKSRTFTCISALSDGQKGTNYGSNLIISGQGNTFIGGGESAQNVYDIEYKNTQWDSGEYLNLTSDSHMYFYVNCHTIANRRYARLSDTLTFWAQKKGTETGYGNIGSSGNPWKNVYAVNGTIQTSDEKAKKDIEDIAHAKELILGIRPRQFRYKAENSDRMHYGFIAQQFKQAMTAAGIEDCGAFALDITQQAEAQGYTRETAPEEEKIYGLRYEELISPIVAVIQEQEQRIKELERIINNGQ